MVNKVATNKGNQATAQAAPEAVPTGESAPNIHDDILTNLEKLTPDEMKQVEDFISKAEAEMEAERKASRRADTLASLSPRAQARLDMFLEAERKPAYEDRYIPLFAEYMAEQVMNSLMTTDCRDAFYQDGSDLYFSYMYQIAWTIQSALIGEDIIWEGVRDYLADLEGGDDE